MGYGHKKTALPCRRIMFALHYYSVEFHKEDPNCKSPFSNLKVFSTELFTTLMKMRRLKKVD